VSFVLLLYVLEFFCRCCYLWLQVGEKCLESVGQFKYLGTYPTNQNSIHEQIKSRLTLWQSCCRSVQNRSSSTLLSKNINSQIHRSIILPVVLYGFEASSLTSWEERRLRVFENGVLRKILGQRETEKGCMSKKE
jgi:hypothetical protein